MLYGKSLVFLALFAGAPGTHYPLPNSAIIKIGQMEMDHTYPDPQTDIACKNYHLTEVHVRNQFHTYHKLHEGEYHDYYLNYPCWIHGTVEVDGRIYTFSSELGNTMETTWPDGVKKSLGGKHTDNPSGK
jgi:hypothetical protein